MSFSTNFFQEPLRNAYEDDYLSELRSCWQGISDAIDTIEPVRKPAPHADPAKIHYWCEENQDILSKIQEISFRELNVESIPTSIFPYFKNLLILKIDSGKILTINENAFFPLSNLKTLIFTRNQTKTITYGAFKGLYSLEKLYLQENKIDSIDDQSFFNMQNLEVLDISSNQLTDLYGFTFDPLRNLKELRLHGNRLERIPPSLPRLHHLALLTLEKEWVGPAEEIFDKENRFQIAEKVLVPTNSSKEEALSQNKAVHLINFNDDRLLHPERIEGCVSMEELY